MLQFSAGFDRQVITPPHGVTLRGYFFERVADGVLDDLELNTVALSDGEKTVVLIVADLCMIAQTRMDAYRHAVSEKTGVPYEAVYIACTHTHTGPDVATGESVPGAEIPIYHSLWERSLGDYMVSSAVRAIEDLAPASVAIGTGLVERVSFVRRYRMKDGGVRTNPGENNPDIVSPIGTPDETEQVIRIRREGGKRELVLVNFQVHPDVIGGNRISADYPRFVRETVERGLDEAVYCVYLNGAQGDVNHVNNFPRPGEDTGLEPDTFDGVLRGYEFAKNMGRAIAGEALKVYGKTHLVAGVPVRYAQDTISLPANVPSPEQLPMAEQIAALHNAGRDADLPYEGMELTTAVAEALRMLELRNGPDAFKLHLAAVSFGPVVLLGIPGEPFTGIGRAIKAGSPYEMTIPTCLTNGAEGYFPMQEAYDEGGYEARSSSFKGGVAESIAAASVALIQRLHAE